MRDRMRKERVFMEQAYREVNENCGEPEAEVMVTQDPVQAVDVDITTLATQAIAAITELATAAGADLSVTVETAPEEIEVVDQFNVGYEDVGCT
jgi:hypothetical protein